MSIHDPRYTVTVEQTTHGNHPHLKPGQEFVARFNHEWISGHGTRRAAEQAANRHAFHADRALPYPRHQIPTPSVAEVRRMVTGK